MNFGPTINKNNDQKCFGNIFRGRWKDLPKQVYRCQRSNRDHLKFWNHQGVIFKSSINCRVNQSFTFKVLVLRYKYSNFKCLNSFIAFVNHIPMKSSFAIRSWDPGENIPKFKCLNLFMACVNISQEHLASQLSWTISINKMERSYITHTNIFTVTLCIRC